MSLSINRKNDQRCLVGASAHLQEIRSPDAGRAAAEKEEQPSVHSRRAQARAAPLEIGQKPEVVISLGVCCEAKDPIVATSKTPAMQQPGQQLMPFARRLKDSLHSQRKV